MTASAPTPAWMTHMARRTPSSSGFDVLGHVRAQAHAGTKAVI